MLSVVLKYKEFKLKKIQLWPREMSGRPRTTSFAEGNKQPPNPVLGGMKISSKLNSMFLRLFS